MKNLFIIGPVASGKTSVARKIETLLNMISFDTGLLFRFLGWVVYNKTQICPNILKVRAHNKNEINRIHEEIYNQRKIFKRELGYISLQKHGEILYKNVTDIVSLDLYNTQINLIVPVVATSHIIRTIIMRFINDTLSMQKGHWILTGHTLFDLNLSDFLVIFLDVNNDVAAKRLINRNPDAYEKIEDAYYELIDRNTTDCINQSRKIVKSLYSKIYLNTDNYSIDDIAKIIVKKVDHIFMSQNKFENYQQRNAYKISEFKWMTNPFLIIIMDYIYNKLSVSLDNYPQISLTDLMYQVLIHICSYPKDLLFLCDTDILKKMDESIFERNSIFPNQALELYKKGEILLNEKVINQEIIIRSSILNDLIQKMKMQNFLLSVNANDVISFYKKTNVKITDSEITIKKISKELSYKIFSVCHYLHTPREDEYAAYGAFYANNEFPIAAVSFSLHDRNYKRQIIEFMGFESQNFMEVTRTWCSNVAPKNTQSYLLEFAMNDLRAEWRNKKSKKEVTNILQGFTTTIDPNLNFQASSFLGCNFNFFALRPAKYNYVKIDGINYFRTRRSKDFELYSHFVNKINILPLNEMIRIFDKNTERQQHSKFIYLIDEHEYERLENNDLF